jgi:predicted ATP-grasp superfamily ATP-dependent carboligase
MMTVLVTDEHYKHTLGVVRQLGNANISVHLMAHSPDALACASRFCSHIIHVPESGVDALVLATLKQVQRHSYDLLLPIGYKTTLALAQAREQFLPHVHLEIAEYSKIETASDKYRMARLCEDIGVPVPRSFVPTSETELRQIARDVPAPYVIKPQKESPGRSVLYARNEEELLSVYRETFFLANGTKELPILQEFIPGYGCGFFATYQNGVCKRIFMHRRIREYPASGGVSTCAESYYHPQLEEYGRRVLDALQWHGVAMAEFRFDTRHRTFKLIEVNPKFWGSLELALAAGADFPGDLCKMTGGKTLQFTGEYNRSLRFHWPFSCFGELYHLKSQPRSIFEVTRDLLNPNVKSNVWLHDLAPNVRELCALGGALFHAMRS